MPTTGKMAAVYTVAEARIMMVQGFRLELVDQGKKLHVVFETPESFEPKALEWGVGIGIYLHSDHATIYLLQGVLRHVVSNLDRSLHTYKIALTSETASSLAVLAVDTDGRAQNVSHIALYTIRFQPGRRLDSLAKPSDLDRQGEKGGAHAHRE